MLSSFIGNGRLSCLHCEVLVYVSYLNNPSDFATTTNFSKYNQ